MTTAESISVLVSSVFVILGAVFRVLGRIIKVGRELVEEIRDNTKAVKALGRGFQSHENRITGLEGRMKQ